MRKSMIQPLGDDLRKRNALWPQQIGEFNSPDHRRPAVFRRNTHHDGRPAFKLRLEDVVAPPGAEPAHLDRQMADRRSGQIAGNRGVWYVDCHGLHSIVYPTKITSSPP